MSDNFKFSKKWIKQRHSLNEIRVWLRDLKYFKYFRAFGGHMNDGDSFKVSLKFKDFNELITIMNLLGFHLDKAILKSSNDYEIVTPEYDKINDYPEFVKPGHQEVLSVNWFLWIADHSLTITIAGTGIEHNYDVTNEDFEKCLEFEKLLDERDLNRYIDKTLNIKSGCISAVNYPDLFKNIK